MKHMTNEQIEEINMLLETHGKAMTAFYDEGMSRGAANVLQGMMVGFLILVGVELVKGCIRIRKAKIEL